MKACLVNAISLSLWALGACAPEAAPETSSAYFKHHKVVSNGDWEVTADQFDIHMAAEEAAMAARTGNCRLVAAYNGWGGYRVVDDINSQEQIGLIKITDTSDVIGDPHDEPAYNYGTIYNEIIRDLCPRPKSKTSR